MSSSSNPHLPAIIATSGKPIPIDRAAYYRQQRQQRDFAVGAALVDLSDADPNYGRAASDQFAPEEYGDYAWRNLPVFVAARFRAANIGRLDLKAYRVHEDGEREEVTTGRLVELLRHPNSSPYWTFKRLIRMTEWARCLWGAGFWVMERGAAGRLAPQEMWWVKPSNMRPVIDPQQYLVGWVYEANGGRIPFTTSEVVWLPMDNPVDEFSGLSPLAPLRISVDIGYEAMRSNKARMRNGARISTIVSPESTDVPWTEHQVEMVVEQFRQLYQGVDNAGRTAILSGAARVAPFGLTPAEMEYLEQLRWTLGDAARAYGISPESLGDHEHATYSNVEQAEKANWINTLRPEADDMADLLTRQLRDVFPGEFDLLEFDFSQIETLQEDRAEIVEQMERLWNMGVPLNRLLQEHLPHLLPVEGEGYEWGDVPAWEAKAAATIAIAEATAPDPQEQPQTLPAGDDANPARAALRLLEAERARMVAFGSDEHERRWNRFLRQTERQERSFIPALEDMFRRQQESVLARLRERGRDALKAESDPFDRAEWERRYRQMALPFLRDIVGDAAADTLDELRVNLTFDVTNPLVTAWLSERTQRFAQQVNETTWERLKTSLGQGIDGGESIDQLSDRVRGVFSEASERRARTIARTETISASNAGSLEGARQSGVVKGKRWLSALDSRTRNEEFSHVTPHGQTRGLDEPFEVSGERLQFPGDSSLGASAGNVINCRCTVTWVVD